MTAPAPSSSHACSGRLGRASVAGGGRPRAGSGLSSSTGAVAGRSGSSVEFAAVARSLSAEARGRGLVVPGFRSPPRLAGAERTLRRTRGGAPTVAVRLRGRPFAAVVSDMVEGVIVSNGLAGPEATRVRTALWEAATVHTVSATEAA